MAHLPDDRSRRWHSHLILWKWAILVFCIVFVATTYRVRESKALYFEKAKESRRGTIRKAKENRETLVFTQQREGVVRRVWIQDPDGARRQFFLEATTAEISTSVSGGEHPLTEFFTKPKGCLQEELFWEVSSTGEKVVQDNDHWVRESPPHTVISEKLSRQIVPVQHVRFFDAQTATWDPSTNKLVANTAFFCVSKIPGHDLPDSWEAGQAIAKGTASSITFQFDKKGRQQVNCQGVKLHLNQAVTK